MSTSIHTAIENAAAFCGVLEHVTVTPHSVSSFGDGVCYLSFPAIPWRTLGGKDIQAISLRPGNEIELGGKWWQRDPIPYTPPIAILTLLRSTKFYQMCSGFADLPRSTPTCFLKEGEGLLLGAYRSLSGQIVAKSLADRLPKDGGRWHVWAPLCKWGRGTPLEIGRVNATLIFRWGVHRVILVGDNKTPPPF
jgi:hypothetical protein